MSARTLWVYWENPPDARDLPPHIALCLEIMERKALGYDLKVVTPANVRSFIPDLPGRINEITLKPEWRLNKYFRRNARRAAAIALRADYIRAFLLERHGGIYLDCDAIVLGDLVPLFDEVDRKGFIICRRESFGKTHVSVGMYGSTMQSPIIRDYARALRARLAGQLNYSWNEIGSELLTGIVDRYLDYATILPEKIIQPITHEEADTKFASATVDLADVITPETKIFMLFSGPFKGSLAGLDKKELLASDRLISKVFRYALRGQDNGRLDVSRN